MARDAKLNAVASPPPEPIARPAQLEPSDLAYQQAMLGRIRRELAEHQGLLKCWSEYVALRYDLSPTDRVQEDGRIVRQEPTP